MLWVEVWFISPRLLNDEKIPEILQGQGTLDICIVLFSYECWIEIPWWKNKNKKFSLGQFGDWRALEASQKSQNHADKALKW